MNSVQDFKKNMKGKRLCQYLNINAKNADTKQNFWKRRAVTKSISVKNVAAMRCRDFFQHFLREVAQNRAAMTAVQPGHAR